MNTAVSMGSIVFIMLLVVFLIYIFYQWAFRSGYKCASRQWEEAVQHAVQEQDCLGCPLGEKMRHSGGNDEQETS